MKVLVAEERTGALKAVELSQKDDNEIATEAKTIHFGAEGRSAYIRKMILVRLSDNKDYIIVARKGGVVQMYDAETCALLKEWKPATVPCTEPIVALEFIDGKLCTCTVSGHIVVRDLESNDTEVSFARASIEKGRSPVSCLRMHPKQPGLAACGGKDRNLELLRIFGDDDDDDGTNVFNNWVIRRLWAAKNVRSDEYGDPPVWISDIRFLDPVANPDEGYRIATATRYGEIHIYYTLISKRPIYNVRASNHPLSAIWPLRSYVHDTTPVHDRSLLWCDAQDKIGKFSTISGKVTNEYKCPAGTALELDCMMSPPDETDDHSETTTEKLCMFATGGLDGKLRVYDVTSGKLLGIAHVGSKISSVLLLDNTISKPSARPEDITEVRTDRLVRKSSSSESDMLEGSSRKRLRV